MVSTHHQEYKYTDYDIAERIGQLGEIHARRVSQPEDTPTTKDTETKRVGRWATLGYDKFKVVIFLCCASGSDQDRIRGSMLHGDQGVYNNIGVC